jgi:hypothetical protein
MNTFRSTTLALTATVLAVTVLAAIAQAPNRREGQPPQDFVVGPGGPGGPPGGARGGMMGPQETRLLERFDKGCQWPARFD